jgi:hypothetical protein
LRQWNDVEVRKAAGEQQPNDASQSYWFLSTCQILHGDRSDIISYSRDDIPVLVREASAVSAVSAQIDTG